MNPTKEFLLSSPRRTREQIDLHFNEIFLIPLESMHDSGYHNIAIVGLVRTPSTETTLGDGFAYYLCHDGCDDIETHFSDIGHKLANLLINPVRMDCVPPDRVLRYHSNHGYFTVSCPISSMEITFHLNNPLPN